MYSKAKLNWSNCFCENNNNNNNNNSCTAIMSKSSDTDRKAKQMKNGTNGLVILHHNSASDKKPARNIEIRKEEVLAIRNRFPTKIPVIVQKFYKEAYLPQLDKSKFLVPQDITMSQFQTIIRNRMRMAPNQALYLLVNERSMLSLSRTLGEVYSEHAGSDGFLYVTYASQEVFGNVYRLDEQ